MKHRVWLWSVSQLTPCWLCTHTKNKAISKRQENNWVVYLLHSMSCLKYVANDAFMPLSDMICYENTSRHGDLFMFVLRKGIYMTLAWDQNVLEQLCNDNSLKAPIYTLVSRGVQLAGHRMFAQKKQILKETELNKYARNFIC